MSQFLVRHFRILGGICGSVVNSLQLNCVFFNFICLCKGWGPEGYNLAMVSAEEESGSAGNVVVVLISNDSSSLLPYLENKMKYKKKGSTP